MKRKIYLIAFLICFIVTGYSQDKSISSIAHDSIQLNKYIKNAKGYFYTDYDKAYQIALKGLSKYKNTDYILGRIRLFQILAEINYYYKNSFDSSLVYLNKMRELSDKIGLKRGKPWYELNLGNIYYYQNDLVKSMQLYKSAKKNAEGIKDSIIIIDALLGISDIEMQWNNLNQSLSYLYEGLGYAKSLTSSDAHFYPAGEINRIKKRMQFLLYDDIANIYKIKNRYDSSYIYYQKTREVVEELNHTFGKLVTKLNLLEVQYKLNPKINVIRELEQLLVETEEKDFMRLHYETGFTICEILQDKGQYEKAYYLYEKMFKLKDSIIGNEGIRRVAEIESDYHLKKKELENRELMRQNEIKTLKLRNRWIIIVLIGFILIQALVLLIIIYRKYQTIKQNLNTIKEQERKIFDQEKELLHKEKEAVELQLRHKEREHTTKAMKIFQHNQLVQKIVDELKESSDTPRYILQLIPFVAFIWYFLLSVPVGIWQDKAGKKKVVNVGILVTVIGLFVPLFGNTLIVILVAFALLG
ncbi:MAG: MFS transporter, partial [Bacteroidota bacterium]